MSGKFMTRSEVIKVLTNGGHTISKAIEIALDYERGDEWARKWVAAIQSENWPLRRAFKAEAFRP